MLTTILSTLKARGGQEWLHATWGRTWSPGPAEPRGPAARGWCKTTSPPGAGEPFSGSGPRSGDPAGSRGPGPRRSPGPEVRDPGGVPLVAPGAWEAQFPDLGIPRIPDPGSGVSGRRANRGFTSTPRGGPPRFPGGGAPDPGVAPGPRGSRRPPPSRGEGSQIPLFRDPRTTPPPRGVDVKETPAGSQIPKRGSPGPGSSKQPKSPFLTEIPFDLRFLKSKRIQSKMPKMRVITHFWGFWLFFGVFGPLRGPGRLREGCFTSTSRAGAPRFPAGVPGYPPGGVAPSGGEGRIPSPSERRLPEALAEASSDRL